jgi:hypothetical protein
MNTTQCQQLFEAFVKKPKSDIARTLLRLHPTAQARAVLCPWLEQFADAIDSAFSGSNWDRSCVVYQGSQSRQAFARFIAELRLQRPDQFIPDTTQRHASLLFQYAEIHEVFKFKKCVTTKQVCEYFKGSYKDGPIQTPHEAAGPDVWIALVRSMGYPELKFEAYEGRFHTDHMLERCAYTARSRDVGTLPDTISVYSAMYHFFNTHANLKAYGLEKDEWYGVEMMQMARSALRFRCDYALENEGNLPTLQQWVDSDACKPQWKPSVTILKRSHRLYTKKGTIEAAMSSSAVAVEASVGVSTAAAGPSSAMMTEEVTEPAKPDARPKPTASTRKRPVAAIESSSDEEDGDDSSDSVGGVVAVDAAGPDEVDCNTDDVDTAKNGSNPKKSKEESLALLEKIMVAFQGTEAIDRVRFLRSGYRRPMEKAVRKKALRVLGVDKLPSSTTFTQCTFGEDGWLAGIGVPRVKRSPFAVVTNRIATLTAEQLDTSGGSSVKEMCVSWRDGKSKHHMQIWVWTGTALATRAAICSQMTAREIYELRVCKGCGKVKTTHCGCSTMVTPPSPDVACDTPIHSSKAADDDAASTGSPETAKSIHEDSITDDDTEPMKAVAVEVSVGVSTAAAGPSSVIEEVTEPMESTSGPKPTVSLRKRPITDMDKSPVLVKTAECSKLNASSLKRPISSLDESSDEDDSDTPDTNAHVGVNSTGRSRPLNSMNMGSSKVKPGDGRKDNKTKPVCKNPDCKTNGPGQILKGGWCTSNACKQRRASDRQDNATQTTIDFIANTIDVPSGCTRDQVAATTKMMHQTLASIARLLKEPECSIDDVKQAMGVWVNKAQ